ncbi:MAG: sulfatase-like hydrolase/transferase [Sphingomonadales bacterium]
MRRALAVSALSCTVASGAPALEVLPKPESRQPPVSARTIADAPPEAWPERRQAPKGAPNILVIMTDDIGFAASSTFGGPIPTPTLDALAREGLRYNQFNTSALCSPTRAALLTGRNPHRVGMARTENHPLGFDGYNSVIPKSAGMISEVLRQNGYSTAAFGKWHLIPQWEQSFIGPFDRWPTGQGFEYYYGFIGADTSQWAPTLVENTVPVAPPADDPSYHLDRDLADQAIGWIRQQQALAPDRPFFVYYTPGTAHAPNHAPKDWIDKFRGKFDQGWDAVREESFARQKAAGIVPDGTQLTPRPANIPAWSSLNPDQKRLYTRLMEVYAASIAYMDAQVGRLVAELRQSGEWDNTVVIFIEGDNGSSGEGSDNGRLFEQSGISGFKEDFAYMLSRIDDLGGPSVYSMIPTGWGWAMDTPFQWYKRASAHFGGTRNGMVVSWPSRVKDKGGIRSQFHYVSDIAPTVLEMAGVKHPDVLNGARQMSVDGISMVYSIDDKAAPSRRTSQVFEDLASWGIYKDGWVAAAPFELNPMAPPAVDNPDWELYEITADFSQASNVASAHPEKLAELRNLFWAEAERNNILPIVSLATVAKHRPSMAAGRTVFTYPDGIVHVNEDAAPPVVNRSFTIEADITVPESGARGVIATQGGRFGGYALYLHEGRLAFHYNAVDPRAATIRSPGVVPPGARKVSARFAYDGGRPGAGGTVSLFVDGVEVAEGRIPHTLGKWLSHTEGLDIGIDLGTSVSKDYDVRDSAFTGEIGTVTFRVDEGASGSDD